MSHHILEQDPLDLDHKLSDQPRQTVDFSSSIDNGTAHIDGGRDPVDILGTTPSTSSPVISASNSALRKETSPAIDHQHFQSRWTDPATPTSPSFRYPALPVDVPQANILTEPTESATATLHLRPGDLVADQDRRAAAIENEEELEASHEDGFESLKAEDEDFYDSQHSSMEVSTASLGSSTESPFAPLFRGRRPFVQTSPAPEGCGCGAAWHSPQSSSLAEASPPRFLSGRNTPRELSPTPSLPVKLENPTLLPETYVPLGALSGRSAVSSTDNSGLWSGITLSALPQIPPASGNSPHDELPPAYSPAALATLNESGSPSGQDQTYIGSPGSSSKWPHYFTPIRGSEEAKTIKCSATVSPSNGEATTVVCPSGIPRSQSSDWLQGKLDRVKNASSSSIHANVKSIDDVKRCPAVLENHEADKPHLVGPQPHSREPQVSGHQASAISASSGYRGTEAIDSKIEYWIERIAEWQDEMREYDLLQPEASMCGNPQLVVPRINVRTRKSHVRQAIAMLAMMEQRGFQRTPEWEARHIRFLSLARRLTAYPLLSFMIEGFAHHFIQALHEDMARKQRAPGVVVWDFESNHHHLRQSAIQTAKENLPPTHGGPGAPIQTATSSIGDQATASKALNDLDAAATRGVIDGCEAVMRLMKIVGSCPGSSSRKQYDTLVENARRSGEVEPLTEFVRSEAKKIIARNASARAAALRGSKSDEAVYSSEPCDCEDCNGANDSSTLTGTSANTDSDDSVSEDEEHTNEMKLSRWQRSRRYEVWMSNTAPDVNGDKDVWVAIPWIGRDGPMMDSASKGIHETRKPVLLTIGHFFENENAEIEICIMALAVKVTQAEKRQAERNYAKLVLQDSGRREKISNPLRVQGFSIRGFPFELDQEAINKMMIEDLRMIQHSKRKGKQRPRSELDGQLGTATQDHQSSSSSSGITLHRHESDEPTVGESDVHLSAAETRELHSQVFSNEGMTLVPLEEFPAIPAQPDNLGYRQIPIGYPPSTIFVNCERCHKILASFENVDQRPTVLRRAEGEPGDTYIVSAISSLHTIVSSTHRVNRVWVHVPTEKYFMRANEEGHPRTHECVSVEETIRAELLREQAHQRRLWAAPGHVGEDYDRLGDLPPREQWSAHTHMPRSDSGQARRLPTASIRMPSSMQFLPMHPNFATAEMKAHPPCTVIAVCERLGTIHGVYQGVVGYRAIYRGHREQGETVRLEIRDGLGSFVGRLRSVRYYEVGIMDGQAASFAAQDQIVNMPDLQKRYVPQIAEMDAHPPCTIIAVCEQQSIAQGSSQPVIRGVYQGVTSYQVVLRDVGESGETVRLDIRDPFGVLIGQFHRVRYYQVAMMNGLVVDFNAQEAGEEIADPAGSQSAPIPHHQSSNAQDMGLRGGALQNSDWESDSETDSEGGELGLRRGGDQESTDDGDASTGPAKEEWVSTGASIERAGKQQGSSPPLHSSENRKEEVKFAAVPHALESSSREIPSQLPYDESDRIPSWLQPTSSVGPATDNDGEPVFTEEYKEWLRSMYTRPSNQHCVVVNGPSFQDFWRNREAGRPATMADGTIYRPQQDDTTYDADIEEAGYIPLQSEPGDEARAESERLPDSTIVAPEAQAEGAPDRTGRPQERSGVPQATGPDPELVRILNQFLYDRALRKARAAYSAAVRGD